MRKSVCGLLAACMLLTLLSGCKSSSAVSSGAGGASSAVSASVSSSVPGASGAGSPAPHYAKQLNFFQWTEYTPQSVLDGFKKKYGISVKMTEYSSNEEMVSKLKAGGLSQYDVTVPSSYTIQPMVQQNLIEKIDRSAVPNLKNIDKSVLGKDFDPNNEYSVPYMIPPCVLVVNTQKVKKPIASFNDLLDPSLKNQLVVVDDERSIIAVALKALGYSINDKDFPHLQAALGWLKKLKPNIKVFDSDSPKTSLISGDCSVGYVWNGEASLAMKANPALKVVWTSESDKSPIMEMDNLSVIAGTKHKTEAELFINYLLDPNVSAEITAAYPYTNPNRAAHDLLGAAYLNNTAINIGWDRLAKAEYTDDVGNAITLYDSVWTTFKS